MSDNKPDLAQLFASGVLGADGKPLAGGFVYSYTEGSTDAKDIWTGFLMGDVCIQPFPLDSRGVAIVYGLGNYKFVICDSELAVVQTIDNVHLGYDDSVPPG